MSNYDDLKREQEKTNFWLAFMAGSMISLPAWLSGAIDVAFGIIAACLVLCCVLYALGMALNWIDNHFDVVLMVVGALGFVAFCFYSPSASAAGAMFWDSNGNYVGQALSSGPNAVQLYDGSGAYSGQILKSGPRAVQFYGADGSYVGQAINSGPLPSSSGDIQINPNSSDLSNLTGNNPSSGDLSNLTGIHLK